MVLAKRTTSPSNPLTILTTPGPGRTAAKYRRRDAIFAQGDPSHAIHYVQDGKIKLTVVSPHGKEAVIAVLGPGTFLGEECLTGTAINRSTATAFTSVSTLRIEKECLQLLLNEDAIFSKFFTKYLLSWKATI